MTSLPYTVVDAFTTKPFTGNPAAVIVLKDGLQLADTTLQHIAREFNLSETAFLTPKPSSDNPESLTFGLRWFTPKLEVALCGHATLASAHVLFAESDPGVTEIRFETRKAGVLVVSRAPGPASTGYQMQFPAGRTTPVDVDAQRKIADVLKDALAANPDADSELPRVTYVGAGQGATFEKYLLIELEGPVDLAHLRVEPNAFLALAAPHLTVILTAASPDTSNSTTFVSRVFGPGVGIPEDPVTGAAHCLLGPYWHAKLKLDVMRARQVSERGGEMRVEYDPDEENGVCRLTGEAVTVARGELVAFV